MAYGKKSYGRKKGGAKKPAVGQSKLSHALEMAGKALKLATYIKGMVNCEKHYADANVAGVIDYNGAINLISNIAEGNDVNNRNGNSILCRSIYMKQKFAIGAGTSTDVRTIIFIDKQNNGSTPTPADVLEQVGSVYGTISPLQKDHGSRFKILRDFRTQLSAVSKPVVDHTEFIKLYYHQKFTGPAYSDVYTNTPYVLNISDAVANLPTVTSTYRQGFYDN